MAEAYDIFISHAGEDKDTIAAPVYNELSRRGVRAFLDREELAVGRDAPRDMRQAMETANAGIFLLSPEFAAKKWPMEELFCLQRRVEEAESQGLEPPILIPVFYRLSIAQCRYGDLHSLFGDVFLKHHFFERVENDEIKMKTVKEALRKLTTFTGIEFTGDVSASTGGGNDVQHLVRQICDKACDALRRKRGPRSERSNATSMEVEAVDRYVSTVFAPSNAREVVLDFDGTPQTPEGLALEKVVDEKESTFVRVLSIEGMAGVGKSCVLRGIARSVRANRRFKDGVFFVSLGMDATMSTLISELLNVLQVSGGISKAQNLRGENRFHIVVHELRTWFRGKRCLLLVDDLWQRNGLGGELITELRSIFSAGSGSVLVLTTRFSTIAVVGDTEHQLKLEPREPRSAACEAILLEYAKCKKSDIKEKQVDEAFQELLEFCKGLPVWLAAVGGGAAVMGRGMESEKGRMWTEYNLRLKKTKSRLGMKVEGYDDLQLTLAVSLSVLEEYGCREINFNMEHGMGQMHRSLCVFPKQTPVPVSVLRRLWGLKEDYHAAMILRIFASGGLAEVDLSTDRNVERMRLHDLVHDFAMASAQSENEYAVWHKRLLDGYIRTVEGISFEDICSERDSKFEDHTETWSNYMWRMLWNWGAGSQASRSEDCIAKVRDWWNVEDDDYIYGNLSRHLAESENGGELVLLALNGQWTLVRHKIGGILQWKKDFGFCEKEVEKASFVNENDREEILKGLKLVRDAMCECWSFVSRNQEELGFQVYGRLLAAQKPAWVLNMYLRSVHGIQASPWLQPSRRCWEIPGEGQMRTEVDLGRRVMGVGVGDSAEKVVVALGKDVCAVNGMSGEVQTRLQGHTKDVNAVDISADGQYVVSGSNDCTVRVWGMNSGREVCNALRGHAGPVTSVGISADGRYLVSGSSDRSLRVWSVLTGKEVREALQGHERSVTSVGISGDGRYVVSGSRDKTVRIWDVESGKEMHGSLLRHDGTVTSVGINRDGRYLVSGSEDNSVRVWDVQSGAAMGIASKENKSLIRSVAISASGDYVVSGSDDKIIRVWELQRLDTTGQELRGHTRWVRSVKISGDGRHLVSSSDDWTVRVWDMKSEKKTHQPLSGHQKLVTSVQISGDGNYVVSGSIDCTVRVWDVKSGREICVLQGHTGIVESVGISMNGKYVVSSARDSTIRVWMVNSMKEIHRLRGVRYMLSVGVSDSGRYVLGLGSTGLRAWDAANGKAIASFGVSSRFNARRFMISGRRVWIMNAPGRVQNQKLPGNNRVIGPFQLSQSNILPPDAQEMRIECSGREVTISRSGHVSVLGTLPSACGKDAWQYDATHHILVTGLYDGQVLCHKLIT